MFLQDIDLDFHLVLLQLLKHLRIFQPFRHLEVLAAAPFNRNVEIRAFVILPIFPLALVSNSKNIVIRTTNDSP